MIERLLSVLFWGVRKHHVDRNVCAQRPCYGGGGSGKSTLDESPTRLEVGCPTQRVDRGFDINGECEGIISFVLLVSGAECNRRPRDQSDFLLECRLVLRVIPQFNDLSRPTRVLYRRLVEGGS